jgi:uncharacterized protein YoxC
LIPLNTPAIFSDVGDGSEKIFFPIPFPTFEENNIEVEVITPLGVSILLTNQIHYNLTSIGIPNTDASLILVVSPSFEWTNLNGLKQGYTLRIKFTTKAEQPAKLRDLGRFAPEVFEKVLDRLTMNILAIREFALEVKPKFEELIERIIGIEEDIAGQQEEIDALAEKDIELKEEIDALATVVSGIGTTVTDLEQRVVDLENVEPTLGEVVAKEENFTAEYNKVYVVSNPISSQSYSGNGIAGSFQITIPFTLSSDLSVFVLSPTLEGTILIEGTFPNDYEVVGNVLNLLGGPGKPWISDGGFGGLEVGWTLVIQNLSLNNIDVTLPAPQANKTLYIKKIGGSTITLIRSGAVKIDNVAANKILTSEKESVTLITDGVDWFII